MYASAIVVLFLFVITLLGVDEHESLDEPIRFQRPVAIGLGMLLLGAGHRARRQRLGHRRPFVDAAALEGPRTGNVETLARSAVHRLHLGVRDHRGAARDRGRRGRCARAPQRPAAAPAEAEATAGRAGERRGDRGLEITPAYYLILAAHRCSRSAVSGCCVRRNTLVMFMCIELMLNAANLTFVTFAKALDDIGGQVIVFFTLVVAAAEVAVGLAIIVAIFRRRQNVTADDVNILEG